MTIITSFQNPITKLDSLRGVAVNMLRQLLIESGYETYLAGTRCKTNKDCPHFLDLEKDDMSRVENIVIYLTPINFYAGTINLNSVKMVEMIARNKDKNIFILATDPRIRPLNPAEALSKRFNKCTNIVNDWNDIIANATYLFAGNDLKKFWKDKEDRRVKKLDLQSYMISRNSNIKITPFTEEDKEWRCVYFGDKRGSHRENKLKKYTNENDLLIGYKSPNLKATQIDKVKHSELQEKINKCKVSLICADLEHEDNMITLRVYESLASSTLVAIDIAYDPHKKLIQNERLRDIVYVNTSEDIDRIAQMYSKELIELQHIELQRLFNKDYTIILD